MKSNKQKWAQRHAEGKTKLDVAIETQLSADAAFIFNSVKKATEKTTRKKVDALAEANEDAAVKIEKATTKKQAETAKEAEVKAAGDKALDAKANEPKVSL